MNKLNTQTNTAQSGKSLWIGDIENWMDEKYIHNLFLEIGK